MRIAGRSEIVEFLNVFKGCINLNKYSIKNREKNIQGLIDLGFTLRERIEVLLSLVPEDYVKGPEPDETEIDKDVWVFGKKHQKVEIYIKIRVVDDNNCRAFRALVWSFHPAEYDMIYPLAE